MEYTDEYVPNHALICAINMGETDHIRQLLLHCPLIDIFNRYGGLFSYAPIVIAFSETEVPLYIIPFFHFQELKQGNFLVSEAFIRKGTGWWGCASTRKQPSALSGDRAINIGDRKMCCELYGGG